MHLFHQRRMLFIGSLLGWCVASCFSAQVAEADSPSGFILENNQWEQLSIPGSGTGLSVRQLFAGSLPAETYGTRWILYLFDAERGAYRDPGIDGVIPQGAGFWMIQNTNSAVILEFPENLSQAEVKTSSACASIASCTEYPAVFRTGRPTYNMVGSALVTPTSLSEIRIKTQAPFSGCHDGRSLEEASNLQLVSAKLWHYDPSSSS